MIITSQMKTSAVDEDMMVRDPVWVDMHATDGIWPKIWEWEWCGEFIPKKKNLSRSAKIKVRQDL